ncbi:hypothetical protein Bca4012_037215 [Brassica carinata]
MQGFSERNFIVNHSSRASVSSHVFCSATDASFHPFGADVCPATFPSAVLPLMSESLLFSAGWHILTAPPPGISSPVSPRKRWEKSSPAHRKSASADFITAVHIKRETNVSLPKHAMENDDCSVCDLYKEPENSIETLQPTASEPTDRDVDIEDGNSNDDKISAAANLPRSADVIMASLSKTRRQMLASWLEDMSEYYR